MVPRVAMEVLSVGNTVDTPASVVPIVPNVLTSVVPFTTKVVSAGLVVDTVTGVINLTPLIGVPEIVRSIVPGCPAAPFSNTWVSPCPCSLGTAVMNFVGVPVPDVITFVVMIVIGDFMPAVPVTPVVLGCDIRADIGIVLRMVVAGFEEAGDMLPRLMSVCFRPTFPAWEVVMMVAGFPSAEVTSFKMVAPGGS